MAEPDEARRWLLGGHLAVVALFFAAATGENVNVIPPAVPIVAALWTLPLLPLMTKKRVSRRRFYQGSG